MKEGGRDSSTWWPMVSSIRRGVGLSEGSWFEDNLCRVVGGGGSTFFWSDNWVGGTPLRVQFPRLFDLAENKWVIVQDMERSGWGGGGGAWLWRRRLLAWEEETVSECASLLHDVVLQDNTIDRWRWSLDPIHDYSVKGVYTYLSTADVLEDLGVSVFEGVWQKQVPLKVSVFAWRLLRNRLPTKDNLIRRRIIQHDNDLYIGECSLGETADHLLFRCDYFDMVWYRIY